MFHGILRNRYVTQQWPTTDLDVTRRLTLLPEKARKQLFRRRRRRAGAASHGSASGASSPAAASCSSCRWSSPSTSSASCGLSNDDTGKPLPDHRIVQVNTPPLSRSVTLLRSLHWLPVQHYIIVNVYTIAR